MNAEDKTRITVDIYGNQYKLKASTSTNYMKRVAEYVNEQMFRIAKGSPRLDSQKIAVLAAVNMADECFRMNETMEELRAIQKNQDATQVAHDKLLQSYNDLKKELTNNQFIIAETTAQLEQVKQQQVQEKQEVNQSRQKMIELHQEEVVKITRIHQAETELNSQRFLQEKSDIIGQYQDQQTIITQQLDDQRSTIIQQFQTQMDALLEQQKRERSALTQQFEEEKQHILEQVRQEKEELMQRSLSDEAQQKELQIIKEEYRELREEYAKLQNEYNEWIELVDTDSPGR